MAIFYNVNNWYKCRNRDSGLRLNFDVDRVEVQAAEIPPQGLHDFLVDRAEHEYCHDEVSKGDSHSYEN